LFVLLSQVLEGTPWTIHYERDDDDGDGRCGFYYSNTETGESVWSVPPKVMETLHHHAQVNSSLHHHSDGTSAEP
jgi:hypothetical protein